MLKKEQLQVEIDSLPVFELKPVAVKDGDNDGWTEQKHIEAVTEKDKTLAVSIVSERYKLVQFKEIFDKVLGGIGEEMEGETKYYMGSGFMVVFPEAKEIGLTVTNSVDKSWAIHLRFCARHGNTLVYVPTTVAGVREIHVGKIKDTIADFMAVLDQTMDVWKTIVNKFSGYMITDHDFDEVMNMMKAGERLRKGVKTNLLLMSSPSLWNLLIATIKEISGKKTKNTITKEKRLERVSDVIYQYGVLINL